MILLRRPRLPPRPFFCVRMCRRCRNRPRSFDRNRPPSATRCRPKKLCPGTAGMAELSHRMSRLNPTFAPCLPRPAKDPPAGPGWIYEIKHDGFRILARRDRERVRLFTRHGTDFTARYPKIAAAVESLPVRSCALDGVCSALTESNSAGANQCQARARDSVPNAGSSGGS